MTNCNSAFSSHCFSTPWSKARLKQIFRKTVLKSSRKETALKLSAAILVAPDLSKFYCSKNPPTDFPHACSLKAFKQICSQRAQFRFKKILIGSQKDIFSSAQPRLLRHPRKVITFHFDGVKFSSKLNYSFDQIAVLLRWKTSMEE